MTGAGLALFSVLLMVLTAFGSRSPSAYSSSAAAAFDPQPASAPTPIPASTVVSATVPNDDPLSCLVRHRNGTTSTCEEEEARKRRRWRSAAPALQPDAASVADGGWSETDSLDAGPDDVTTQELGRAAQQLLENGMWPDNRQAAETLMLMSVSANEPQVAAELRDVDGDIDILALQERFLHHLRESGFADLAEKLETQLRDANARDH